MKFTPIACYSILFPEIVKQHFPNYFPVLTFKDWQLCFPEMPLLEWVTELCCQTDNVHYGDLDKAIHQALKA